jgi:flagellar protein FliJ
VADALQPLIRLRRFRLDEERRELAAAVAALDGLRARELALDAESDSERAQAAADPLIAGQAYALYAATWVARRARLLDEIAEAEAELSRCRQQVVDVWRDLRTLELAEEERRRRAAAEAARRERIAEDEIAATGWLRARPPQAE